MSSEKFPSTGPLGDEKDVRKGREKSQVQPTEATSAFSCLLEPFLVDFCRQEGDLIVVEHMIRGRMNLSLNV